MNTKFRKKPVVIDAFQLTHIRTIDCRDWPAWLTEAWEKDDDEVGSLAWRPQPVTRSLAQSIKTLEGDMVISPNDWIIKGVQGELYPCKPDIFDATYEPVE